MSTQVTYSPGFLFGAGNNLLQNNPDAIAHFTTSGIRLNIVEPASIVPVKSYVIISDVILDVRCSCSGHANVCGGPVRLRAWGCFRLPVSLFFLLLYIPPCFLQKHVKLINPNCPLDKNHLTLSKDYKWAKIPQLSIFACTVHLAAGGYK